MRDRWLFALAFLFCAGVLFWYITDGDWRPLEAQPFTSYYDGVAQNLLHGRMDVPLADLDNEIFRRDGKNYGYFGPTPALPRIVLNTLFPSGRGEWSRVLMWLMGVGALALNAALLRYCGFALGSPVALAYFVTAALGSTLLFASAWAITYMEALTWAATLAIAAIYALLRYLREPRLRWLAAASVASVLSFFARNATGTGPMLAVACVTLTIWLRPAKRPMSRRVLPAAVLASCAVLFGAINYAKFGSPFESLPIRYYATYSAAFVQKIGGTMIHPDGAPRRLWDYLFCVPELHRTFPWFTFSNANLLPIDWLFRAPLLVGAEWHAGVVATMPAMFLLAVLAVIVGARRWTLRLVLLSPIVGIAVLSSYAWIAQRYVHEFYPFVAVAAPFGLRWLADRKPAVRAPAFALLAALAAWSLAVNPLLALHWQRGGPTWGCNAACFQQYIRMRDRIDTLTRPHRDNLITNPGFDRGAGDWTLGTVNGATDWMLATANPPLSCRPAVWDPASGRPAGAVLLTSCAEPINNPFAAQRVIGLTPGRTYVLTFDWALDTRARITGLGSGKSFAVFLDLAGAPPVTGNDRASMQPAFLGERTDGAFAAGPQLTFTAAGTAATIYFEAQLDQRTPGGPGRPLDISYLLDNVSLRPAVESK